MLLQNVDAMMRDLWMQLTSLLESGDITEEQANEWANMKAEQWKGGAA